MSKSGNRPINPLSGARVTVNLSALADNWSYLNAESGAAECAAVVKADSYGTGVEPTVVALQQAGCNTFFVALPEEGVAVRRVSPNAVIYVLNGLFPGVESLLASAQLRPVLSSLDEVRDWASYCSDTGDRLPAALHAETGINRLGMRREDLEYLAAQDDLLGAFAPTLLMGHLACADEPDHPMNAQQLAEFEAIRRAYPGLPCSLANSSGIFLGEAYRFDLVRPGIALFGGNPTPGNPNPMKTVAYLDARVMQVRTVPAGETVGYGANRTLKRETRLAVIAAGYADGYKRMASNTDSQTGGVAYHKGQAVPLLGRVSMDQITLDATDSPDLQRGSLIELLGDHAIVDDVAKACGTISYEILTNLGHRYERVYIDRHSVVD
ncbi:alanine racemase [Coralliovum pocilloporae]|uniref:alanine racemase n=1 Tax=Coralliovum pocilloporae TaxID=3066369 RepID=UPI0033071F4C